MPKSLPKLDSITDAKAILETLPWSHTSSGDESEIEAFLPATDTWETIAVVRTVNGVDAEDMAAFITRLANTYHDTKTGNKGWTSWNKLIRRTKFSDIAEADCL